MMLIRNLNDLIATLQYTEPCNLYLLAHHYAIFYASYHSVSSSQIDLERKAAWVHPDQAKARKAIHVPLNSIALAVLFRQSGKHPSRVFTYKGRSISWANTSAWRNALKRAGIDNFSWHDLRLTWASWF